MNRYQSLWIFLLISLLPILLTPTSLSFAQDRESPHQPISKNGHAWKSISVPFIQDQQGAYVKAQAPSNKQSIIHINKTLPTHINPESIIGKDDRTQVKNTTEYPYSAIAHIESNLGGCTGWFIDEDLLATAGHCVYDPQSKRWAQWATIYPGRDGKNFPFGYANAVEFYTVTGWAYQGDPYYDYGAIRIERPLGQQTGWFGFRWQKSSYNNVEVNISGYPGDKPYGTQWEHREKIRKSTVHQLHYANDTYNGQSGSPVYMKTHSDCSPCSIAIHTNGVYGNSIYNRGTRINEEVFKNYLLWMSQ